MKQGSKLSHSEAGKLGGEKTRRLVAEIMRERIAAYNKNPSWCAECGGDLDYGGRKKKFCGSSCSATHNNKKRGLSYVTFKCKCCGKQHKRIKWKYSGTGYCDIKCQAKHTRQNRINEWLKGDFNWGEGRSIPHWIKDPNGYLAERDGYHCRECGVGNEYNHKKLVLECDHIDGDHLNNKPNNLRLICPNCHSQTTTYKNRNMGKGRSHRKKYLV